MSLEKDQNLFLEMSFQRTDESGVTKWSKEKIQAETYQMKEINFLHNERTFNDVKSSNVLVEIVAISFSNNAKFLKLP